MLQDLRNPYVMKWGLWIVIAIVVPSFVLFYGFSDTPSQASYSTDLVTVKTESETVKLGADEMAEAKFEAALYYAGIAVRSYGLPLEAIRPVASNIQSAISTEQTAEFAVGQVALRDRLRRQDIRVSDDQVATYLRNMGVNRSNIQQQLERVSAEYGYRRTISESMYAAILRRQIEGEMAQRTVDRIAKVSLLELWLDYRLENELLTVSYVQVPVLPSPDLMLTETQVQEKYNELVTARDPVVVEGASRVYDYVLMRAPYEPVQPPTAEDLRAAYDAAEPGDEAVTVPGGARLRQIVYPTEGMSPDDARVRAEATREIIRGGGRDFAEMADEIALQRADESTTPTLTGGLREGLYQGTEVDIFGEEGAAFIASAEVGDISPAVMTQDGYAVLQVVERVEPTQLSFEEAEATLRVRVMMDRQAQRNQRQAERQKQDAEALRVAAAENPSLEAIAAAVGSDVRTTSPTLATTATIPGIGQLAAFRQEILGLQVGEKTSVLQLPTNDAVILELREELPERELALDRIRPRIESLLRSELAAEEAEMQATMLYEAVTKSEDPLTTVALTMDMTPTTPAPFSRAAIPEELRAAGDAEFEFAKAREGQTFLFGGGTSSFRADYFVVQITKVQEPDRGSFLNEAASLETMLLEAKRQGYVEEFRRQAMEELDVTFAEGLIREPESRSSAR